MLEVFTSLKLCADEQGIILTPEDFWRIARAKGGYAHLAGDDGEIQRAIDGLFNKTLSPSGGSWSVPAGQLLRRGRKASLELS